MYNTYTHCVTNETGDKIKKKTIQYNTISNQTKKEGKKRLLQYLIYKRYNNIPDKIDDISIIFD